MKFRVIIEPDEDGVFVAECPALSGCVSQGKTRDEAVANIRDAIQGYLHSLKKHNEPIPPGRGENRRSLGMSRLPVCSGAASERRPTIAHGFNRGSAGKR